jgi:dipeptide transport system ATP-binding protein
MSEAVLSVRGLRKSYAGSRRGERVQALLGLDFELAPGRSLAIVGESGSGKTTAAMCIAKLTAADQGQVLLSGRELLGASAQETVALRRGFGVVLQNPLTALDPRQRIWRSVAEPLEVHERGLAAAALRERALAMLARVGLSEAMAERLPHQLSGGQLQRAVIARALILQPRLVILDEPTSALDVSVQAQVLNLLCDLRDEFQLSYLFITHNLALVEIVAHEVLVMYAGAVVERGPVHRVFAAPRHPYTAELLAAVPGHAPERPAAATAALPELAAAASGCSYRPRCAQARPSCEAVVPPQADACRAVACHFPLGETEQ